jgi:L-threonylcarbamoyladenylate synthase
MTVVFEVDSSRPEEVANAIAAAADAVYAGGLVVLPTDTVYGVACRPDDPEATTRLFEAKHRPAGLNLPVLAHSAAEALDLTVPNDAADRLARAFWPGPLTIVLARGRRSKGWPLGAATQTIGVRVPDHAFSLALLKRVGPLAATSANISGGEPLNDRAALRDAFGDDVAVYIVEQVPRIQWRPSSTVVDLTGRGPRVLREGSIDASSLAGAVASQKDQSVH